MVDSKIETTIGKRSVPAEDGLYGTIGVAGRGCRPLPIRFVHPTRMGGCGCCINTIGSSML